MEGHTLYLDCGKGDKGEGADQVEYEGEGGGAAGLVLQVARHQEHGDPAADKKIFLNSL